MPYLSHFLKIQTCLALRVIFVSASTIASSVPCSILSFPFSISGTLKMWFVSFLWNIYEPLSSKRTTFRDFLDVPKNTNAEFFLCCGVDISDTTVFSDFCPFLMSMSPG